MIKRLVFHIGIVLAVGFLSISSATAQSAPEVNSAARELIIVMRASDQFQAIMPAVFRILKPVMVQGRPEVERDYDAIQRQLSDAFVGRMSDLMDAMALTYARHFTLVELQALTEFMRSPIGQKFVEKSPVIMQEGMTIGQKFGERIAAEIREKMVEELRKRGHKI
jgi:uncharacterized protein